MTRIYQYYDVNYQYRQKLLADAQAGDEAAKKQIERDRIADIPRNEAAVTQALKHTTVIQETIQQIMNVMAGDIEVNFDMSPEGIKAAKANIAGLRKDGTGLIYQLMFWLGGTDAHRMSKLVEVLKNTIIEDVAKMYDLSDSDRAWLTERGLLSNIWGTTNPKNPVIFMQYKNAVALKAEMKRSFYKDHDKSLVRVEDWRENGFPWPPKYIRSDGAVRHYAP